MAAIVGLSADGITASSSSDRTISFFHIHTQERLTITYKKAGRYDPDALKQINWIMRDWRKNQTIAIDPATIDLAWEMHEELGSREPINIICGYRSRDTNELLRKTVGGQASQSQHITGKAIDIAFPDVPLKRMRYSALIRERGGVGYYPTSGIPFVHVDTARVRSWPRLPRYELALVFPEGRSQHLLVGFPHQRFKIVEALSVPEIRLIELEPAPLLFTAGMWQHFHPQEWTCQEDSIRLPKDA